MGRKSASPAIPPTGCPTPFNGDGLSPAVTLPVADGEVHNGVVAPDGKILIGVSSADRLMVVRFTAGGDVDTTFGGGGGIAEITDFGPTFTREFNGALIAVGDDGRVAIASNEELGSTMTLARLNPDGSLDTSFSGDGKTTLEAPDGSVVVRPRSGIDVLADDKVLVLTETAEAPLIIRFAANGTPDTTFGGGDGIASVPFAHVIGRDAAGAMLLPGDGSIVIGGVHDTTPGGPTTALRAALARLNADGSVDTAFGDNGVAVAGASDHVIAQDVAIDSQGRFVALGPRVVLRWTADGDADTTFDPDGVVNLPTTGSRVSNLALLDNDRLLLSEDDGVVRITPQRPALQLAPSGNLIITELDGDNDISIVDAANDDLTVTINGVVSHFSVAAVKSLNILTGDGADTVDAQINLPAASIIDLGDGANALTLGNGDAQITTGAGADELTVVVGGGGGGGGALTIDSGAGNDTIATGNGVASVNAGAGNDSVTTGNADDSIHAGDGDDTVDAGGGNDRVFGDAGSDSITGGAGADFLVGGIDLVGEESAGGGDNLIHAGDGNDLLIGGEHRDSLHGGANKDILIGRTGSDLLNGGGGKDRIAGNGGNDRIYGGSGDDQLDGGVHDDRIFGGAGSDRIFAGRGVDNVRGGDGNDRFFTRNNDIDHIDGDAGTNTVALLDENLNELTNASAETIVPAG